MSDDELAARVAAALEPEPVADAWPVSRRQALVALASVGGLASVETASAQAGAVTADQAFFSNYDSASTASGYELTIDGDTYSFDGSQEIGLPDGDTASEFITPNGAGATQVLGPQGNVIFDSVPPTLLSVYDAKQLSLSDGDTVTSWPDSYNNIDLISGSGGVYRASAVESNPAVEFTNSSLYATDANSLPFSMIMIFDHPSKDDDYQTIFSANADGSSTAAVYSIFDDYRGIMESFITLTNASLKCVGAFFADNDNTSKFSYKTGTDTYNKSQSLGIEPSPDIVVGKGRGESAKELEVGYMEIHDGEPPSGITTRTEEVFNSWTA